MRVIEVIAIRRKGRTSREGPGLGRHNGNFAAGRNLPDAQAFSFALEPTVRDHFAIGRHGSKADDMPIIGKLANADFACVNRRSVSPQKFVESKSCSHDEHQGRYGDCDHRKLMPPRLGKGHRTDRTCGYLPRRRRNALAKAGWRA
jgi:hypothetical protein